jgi:prolyl 4-hydroxylase
LDGCDDNSPLDRQEIYHTYMEGCYQRYGKEICEDNEQARLEMNYRQPQSVYNFTSGGFRKVKTPPTVFKILKDFWENNRDRMEEEEWYEGNIHTVS